MKFGTIISGVIARFAKDGSGIIERPEGNAFHVYNTIPGETVTARFKKRSKDGPKAELVSIDAPSPDRVTPRCPYAGTCGGCKWQHVDYAAQLRAKLDTFLLTAKEKEMPVALTAVQGALELFYYRNRMDFTFGRNGQLGLKAPDRWWDALDLNTCFLLSPDSVEIMSRVRAWAKNSGLPFWNGDTHEGFFRYLVIREGKRTGERMVMLLTATPKGEEKKKIEELPALLGELATCVVWGVNPLITDLSVAETITPLKGDPWIFEEVNGVRYKITPNAFFQTNTVMAEQLQNKVKEFCGDLSGKTLLDLFCGSGFFSLALAKPPSNSPLAGGETRLPARTIGIELSAEAIACAKENATANGVAAEYFVSKAEEFDWKTYVPDVVILDPPRAGLHPKVIETLLEAKPPRVVYVSCSYPRFLDEMKKLGAVYEITNAAALDLFPHTPHMECVFLLERKG